MPHRPTACPLRCRLVSAALLLAAGASAGAQTGVSGTSLRFGNVRIYNFASSTISLNGAGRASGPHTTVDIMNPANHTTVRMHADEIESRNGARLILMRENVRYHAAQQIGAHTRTVDGTAQSGAYSQPDARIVLRGGVHATVTDPEALEGPATISAETVAASIAARPYSLEMEGSPASSDLRFALRRAVPAKNGASVISAPRIENIHVSGYDTGHFRPGEYGLFEGPQTRADLAELAGRSQLTVEAPKLEVTGEHGDVSTAAAGPHVRFRASGATGHGSAVTSIQGTCACAAYSAASDEVQLAGPVDATFADPAELEGPGVLHADHVVASLGRPPAYRIQGAGANTLLRFTPLPPAEPSPAHPPAEQRAGLQQAPAPSLALGAVRVTGYTTAEYTPGKGVRFEGAPVRMDTFDRRTKSSASLLADDITAAVTGAHITRAEATGSVRYRLEKLAAPSGQRQIVRGSGARLVLAVEGDARTATISGPLTTEVVDPTHLARPGIIRGLDGDSLAMDLSKSVYTFRIESPHETATLDMEPLEPEKTPAAPQKKSARKE